MKKRKLRKWVVVSLAVSKAVLYCIICLFLFSCVMSAWTDAHYQQLAKYESMRNQCVVNK